MQQRRPHGQRLSASGVSTTRRTVRKRRSLRQVRRALERGPHRRHGPSAAPRCAAQPTPFSQPGLPAQSAKVGLSEAPRRRGPPLPLVMIPALSRWQDTRPPRRRLRAQTAVASLALASLQKASSASLHRRGDRRGAARRARAASPRPREVCHSQRHRLGGHHAAASLGACHSLHEVPAAFRRPHPHKAMARCCSRRTIC